MSVNERYATIKGSNEEIGFDNIQEGDEFNLFEHDDTYIGTFKALGEAEDGEVDVDIIYTPTTLFKSNTTEGGE